MVALAESNCCCRVSPTDDATLETPSADAALDAALEMPADAVFNTEDGFEIEVPLVEFPISLDSAKLLVVEVPKDLS